MPSGSIPSHETDGMSLNITSEIFANLVKFKPGTFDVVPDIARSWYASKDGKHWTFTLNPGLKFSDGTPLDAAAVKFNFDRWRLKNDPYHGNFPYGYYASQFGGFPGAIVDVEAPVAEQSGVHARGAARAVLAQPGDAVVRNRLAYRDSQRPAELRSSSGRERALHVGRVGEGRPHHAASQPALGRAEAGVRNGDRARHPGSVDRACSR